MKPPEKVTGLDVARLAGVSKSAVSRAFTGGIVSQEARKRIFEAAKTLKYRPSNTARSLTTSRSRMIGLAVTHLDNQFYPEVVERLSDALARVGYRLLLFITHGEADLDPVLDELLGYGLDAVVLASSSMASRVAAECNEAGVPVVMFNNVDPNGRQLGISAADQEGAACVARFLLAAGHRRTGVICGLAESTTNARRLQGFEQALAQADALPARTAQGHFTLEGARAATHALLDGPDAPDALFCLNDHMAIGALHGLRERGLKPGLDVSVIGFDNVAIAQWPLIDLTTYSQPLERMIAAAVETLMGAIAGRPAPEPLEPFAGQLIVRGSARRPDQGLVTDARGLTYWLG